MDKNEAKQILRAYRADLSEMDDPDVREALRMASEDPQLQALLKKEQAFDRAFAAKLKDIQPPSGLMERILSEATAAVENQTKKAKIIWWRQPGTWAAAACLIALLTVTAVFTQKKSTAPPVGELALMDNFARAAAVHSPTIRPLDFGSHEINDLSAFLIKEGAPNPHRHPHPQRLPDNMDQLSGLGCLTFKWENNPVGILCLKGNKFYNLYVLNREGIATQRDQKEPSFKQFGKYATALWMDGSMIYVLTVEGKPEDLSPLL